MTTKQGPPNTVPQTRPPHRNAISVDLEKYVEMLADLDVPTSEKFQILQSLESILLSFIDLGFNVSFVSESCGQLSQTHADAVSEDGAAMVDSLQSIIVNEFPSQDAGSEGREV